MTHIDPGDYIWMLANGEAKLWLVEKDSHKPTKMGCVAIRLAVDDETITDAEIDAIHTMVPEIAGSPVIRTGRELRASIAGKVTEAHDQLDAMGFAVDFPIAINPANYLWFLSSDGEACLHLIEQIDGYDPEVDGPPISDEEIGAIHAMVPEIAGCPVVRDGRSLVAEIAGANWGRDDNWRIRAGINEAQEKAREQLEQLGFEVDSDSP